MKLNEFEPKPTIRGSLFTSMQKCPGILKLNQFLNETKTDTGNENTSLGKLGHRWLELKMLGHHDKADEELRETKISIGSAFIDTLNELWNWLDVDNIVPAIGLGDEYSLLLETPIGFKPVNCDVLITGTIDYFHFSYCGDTAVIADWKFYNRPEFLPDMQIDMQMLAYGAGALSMNPNISRVIIRRVLCYHYRFDELVIDRETLFPLALQAISSEAESIWKNRNQFNVGSDCLHCLFASHCDAYQAQGQNISTTEIAPYIGGVFAEKKQILNFLLAVPIIEKRIKEGVDFAKAFVREHGNIIDLASGREWGPRERQQDEITDASQCLAELARVTNPKAMLAAAKTTKGGIEKVLKEAKWKAPDRRAFLDELRAKECMQKKSTERWEWK